MTDPRKKPAPLGWRSNRGGRFWTKDTAHGVRYRCKGCAREQLGLPLRGGWHRTGCPFEEPPPLALPPDRVRVEERAVANLLSFVVLVDGEAWCRVPVWHDDAGQRMEAEAKRRADAIAEGLRKVLP